MYRAQKIGLGHNRAVLRCHMRARSCARELADIPHGPRARVQKEDLA